MHESDYGGATGARRAKMVKMAKAAHKGNDNKGLFSKKGKGKMDYAKKGKGKMDYAKKGKGKMDYDKKAEKEDKRPAWLKKLKPLKGVKK